VVIDGVFNHTGRNFFAFQDLLKNGRASRYAGWYMVTRWPEKPGEEFDYKAWWDFKSLRCWPETSEASRPAPRSTSSTLNFLQVNPATQTRRAYASIDSRPFSHSARSGSTTFQPEGCFSR
jgi:glycosidase